MRLLAIGAPFKAVSYQQSAISKKKPSNQSVEGKAATPVLAWVMPEQVTLEVIKSVWTPAVFGYAVQAFS
jgi:hypothetical protein